MPVECSDCRTPLVRGYLFDEGYYKESPADWIEGGPERGLLGGLKTGKRLRLTIEAWRCPSCSKLTLYAPEVTDN